MKKVSVKREAVILVVELTVTLPHNRREASGTLHLGKFTGVSWVSTQDPDYNTVKREAVILVIDTLPHNRREASGFIPR